jgi:hypothetical protein
MGNKEKCGWKLSKNMRKVFPTVRRELKLGVKELLMVRVNKEKTYINSLELNSSLRKKQKAYMLLKSQEKMILIYWEDSE